MPGRSCSAMTGASARLLNFASEEAKHIHLFKRYHAAFVRGFPVECEVIGPSEAIGAEILRHDPLAVGLVDPDDRVDDPAALSRHRSATTATSTLCSRA